MDDYSQPDAPDEYGHPVNKQTSRRYGVGKRGTKGNRRAQAARYHQRNKVRRRAYMRRYMAARRAAARAALL